MEQVVGGVREAGASQPREMVRIVGPDDDVGAPTALALMVLLCVIVLAASHLLGTVDLTAVGWGDVGFGAAALVGLGGIGTLRTITKTTDRLDACEEVGTGVQLERRDGSRSGVRHVAHELWRATRMGAFMVAAIALLSWADGDTARWSLAGCGLVLGIAIQVVVRDRLVLSHERTEGVRVFQPEDPDDWYEETTGKELGIADPGPLYYAPTQPG